MAVQDPHRRRSCRRSSFCHADQHRVDTCHGVTAADGSYILANLPVGPYRLNASKEGFKAAVRSGIVLQVDTGNPVINVTMEIGSVSESVMV